MVDSDTIRKYGGMLGKGLLSQIAPQIVKGALVEVLSAKRLNVKKASTWVEGNVCLWDTLEESEKRSFLKLGEAVTELDWLTADWVIEAIKDDFPAVASLFLGWKRGANWLGRQVDIMKKKIEGL